MAVPEPMGGFLAYAPLLDTTTAAPTTGHASNYSASERLRLWLLPLRHAITNVPGFLSPSPAPCPAAAFNPEGSHFRLPPCLAHDHAVLTDSAQKNCHAVMEVNTQRLTDFQTSKWSTRFPRMLRALMHPATSPTSLVDENATSSPTEDMAAQANTTQEPPAVIPTNANAEEDGSRPFPIAPALGHTITTCASSSVAKAHNSAVMDNDTTPSNLSYVMAAYTFTMGTTNADLAGKASTANIESIANEAKKPRHQLPSLDMKFLSLRGEIRSQARAISMFEPKPCVKMKRWKRMKQQVSTPKKKKNAVARAIQRNHVIDPG